jgi:hypothetical protein
VLRKNRQDAAVAGAGGDDAAYGVVADGCGQGAGSEVGAQLTACVAAAAIARELAFGTCVAEIGARVLASVVSALADTAAHIAGREAREAFVRERLMSTLVGFVVRGEDGLVFASGDGAVLVDDELIDLDADNRPGYPAYELFGNRVDVFARSCSRPRRIAVATDGVDAPTLRRVAGLTGHRLVRELVLAQRAGALADDGSVAVAHRLPDGSGREAASCAS